MAYSKESGAGRVITEIDPATLGVIAAYADPQERDQLGITEADVAGYFVRGFGREQHIAKFYASLVACEGHEFGQLFMARTLLPELPSETMHGVVDTLQEIGGGEEVVAAIAKQRLDALRESWYSQTFSMEKSEQAVAGCMNVIGYLSSLAVRKLRPAA